MMKKLISLYPGIAFIGCCILLFISAKLFFNGGKLLVNNPITRTNTVVQEKIVTKTIVIDPFRIEGDGYILTKSDNRYIIVSGEKRYQVAVKLCVTDFKDSFWDKPYLKEERKNTIVLLIDESNLLPFFEYWNKNKIK